MAEFFYKNPEGVYMLAGVLTYKILEKDWNKLLQEFFVDHEKIILDFENIIQVDSSFLAFLLALVRAAHHHRVVFKIRHMTHDIKSLMQVQGIWPLFEKLMD